MEQIKNMSKLLNISKKRTLFMFGFIVDDNNCKNGVV
jgi:hypothetical protein